MRQVFEICQCESFAKAARSLGVSQPTLSRSIARLEDRLGVILFDRSESGARPTAYGRMIADRAGELLREADALANEIRSVAAGETGRLRIGVGPGMREWIWPPLVQAILARFPDLQLTIQHDPVTVTCAMVAANQLDIALGTVDALRPDSRLIARRLAVEDVVFAARADHPLVQAPGPHSLHELLDYPLAHPGLPPTLHGLLTEAATEAQHRNMLGFRCSDFQYVAQILAAGQAVAPGTRANFEAGLRDGSLALVNTILKLEVDCSLMCTPENLRSPVIREIVDLAVEVGASLRRNAVADT